MDALITLLAAFLAQVAQLTGLTDENAQTLRVTASALDLRGILIAGIVIGALGVLDDVTVTQVAAVQIIASGRLSPSFLAIIGMMRAPPTRAIASAATARQPQIVRV